MKRAEDLRRRLHVLETLSEAVRAMKSLSAHHFQSCRRELAAARTYQAEIERAVAEAGIYQEPESRGPVGLLIVGSDLGLCGDYNSRLVRAVRDLPALPQARLYVVGRRPAGLLGRDGLHADRTYPTPASVAGLSRLLLELGEDVLLDYTGQRIGSMTAIAAEFEGAGHFSPRCTELLPIAPPAEQPRVRPTGYVSVARLAFVAVRELIYTTLHQLLLDALASEHGMRLIATQGAERWLDESIETTHHRIVSSRREATTQEVLEIVFGAKARALGAR